MIKKLHDHRLSVVTKSFDLKINLKCAKLFQNICFEKKLMFRGFYFLAVYARQNKYWPRQIQTAFKQTKIFYSTTVELGHNHLLEI